MVLARKKGIELKPRLHLEKEAVTVVGEMLLDHVGSWHLGVFHQGAAPVPVDIDRHQAFVKPRHAQRAQERVGQFLALKTAVVAGTISGLMDLVKSVAPRNLSSSLNSHL